MDIRKFTTYEEMVAHQEAEKEAFKKKQQEERKAMRKKLAEEDKKRKAKTEKQMVAMLRLIYKDVDDGQILMKLAQTAEKRNIDETDIQKILQ